MSVVFAILNLVVALMFAIHALKKFKTHAVLIVYAMHAVFFCLSPVLYWLLGFSVYHENHTDETIRTYLISGFLGIVFLHISMIYTSRIGNKFFKKVFFKKINAVEGTTRTVTSALIFLVVSLYLINYFKTGNFLYFTSGSNSFELMMSLANGKYFLNFMSGGMLYLCLYIIYVYGGRDDRVNIPLIVVVVLIYLVFAQPSTRTWAITILLSVVLLRYYPSRQVLSRVSLFIILLAPILIISLQALNYLRLGGEGVTLGAIVKGSFASIYLSFLQFENGLSLIKYFDSHDFLYFRFLVAAISPLAPIPSALLPFDKPRADKEAYLTELVFGSGLDLNFYSLGSTLTYTIPISGYADLGYIGSIFSSLIYGALLGILLQGISHGGFSRFLCIYLLISYSAGYRLGTEGMLLSTYSLIILNIIFILFFRVSFPLKLKKYLRAGLQKKK